MVTDDYDAQFSKLRAMLADKYGEPIKKFLDDLGHLGEVFLWPNVNVDNIHSILIMLYKEGRHSLSAIALFYRFTNLSDCKAEAKAMRQENPLLDLL